MLYSLYSVPWYTKEMQWHEEENGKELENAAPTSFGKAYLKRAFKPWSVSDNASVTQKGVGRTGPILGGNTGCASKSTYLCNA